MSFIVIGKTNLDISLSVQDLPQNGETIIAKDSKITIGGKGANQAIALNRLGGKVVFISKIGKDLIGELCLTELLNEGINTEFISYDLQESTSIAAILISSTGENFICSTMGASGRLKSIDLEKAESLFQKTNIMLLQLGISDDVISGSIDLAKKNNVKIIIDPGPYNHKSNLFLEQADIITPNIRELEQIIGTKFNLVTREQIANRLKDLSMPTTVLKMGENGALIIMDNEIKYVPSFKIDAVDTTGAGDAFNAGLAYALSLIKYNLLSAVKFACLCGAFTAQRSSSKRNFPYFCEISDVAALINTELILDKNNSTII